MLRVNAFVWIVWFLYAGTLSSEDLNGCEVQPCHNGGVCASHQGSYRCLCPQQSQDGRLYGGENCSVALRGCDGHLCKNGGICSPLFIDNRHTYKCICPAGFSGPKCRTPTVFSFETRGYVYVETQLPEPDAPLNVTFSFRTARPVGTLIQRRVGDLLLSVELADGRLRLTSLRGRGSSALVQELPGNVADGQWHRAEALLGVGASVIRLLDSPCAEGKCAGETATESTELEQGSSVPKLGSLRQSLFVGAVGLSWGSFAVGATDYPAHFLGCFRDVLVDSRLVPARKLVNSPTRVNVTVGCSDTDGCEDGPCQNRGRCVSQGWRSYVCECQRPYEGPNCAEEHISARFSNQVSQSYALFSLDDDDPTDTVAVSMFVRTRRPSGLLLILANSTSQYLRLWLEEGRVKVQVNNFESLAGQRSVSDGHFHTVTVRLDRETVTLFQSGQSQGAVPIRHVVAQSGDVVFVGGLAERRASASFGGYFKGCVQDLRVNGRRLQFFPIETPVASYSPQKLVNVVPGCTSDDACSINPCLNGGVCYSMWDDFTCSCPPNTAGRRCEEVKWCELSPCPATAVCQPLAHGFECASNVTLRSDSGTLLYRGNGKIRRTISSVRLRVRTRQTDATLLHAERGSESLTISLLRSRLLLELRSGAAAGSPKLTTRSAGALSDGEWHTVEISMEDPDLQTSRWIVAVDGGREPALVSAASSGSLDFLREGVDILLGGGAGPETAGNLIGCLGPVEIGGLPLPYHRDSDLNLARPQEEQFVRASGGEAPQYGCWGASVCVPDPCLNQGVCEDLFDRSFCRCPPGWEGPRCQDSDDACSSGPCARGTCSVLSDGYACACEPGYTGAMCEFEVDVCDDNKCGLGATCLRGLQDYSCLCPRNMTGPYCTERVPEMPWYIDKFQTPNLPVSICLGNRGTYSCFNGGHCATGGDSCQCLPGFVGQWCEVDVDECKSNPCEHGGYCRNLVNGFHCICEINYTGEHCQIDINDFYFLIFVLLWQNLFQLMSYLVLRFDEGPEIEWEWD